MNEVMQAINGDDSEPTDGNRDAAGQSGESILYIFFLWPILPFSYNQIND